MAFIPVNDDTIPYLGVDGTVLQASTTLTSSAASTAVEMGKGLFAIDIDITASHFESGFDSIIFWVEANTKAATSTYEQIGCLAVGDATGVGTAILVNEIGNFPIYVYNVRDNGIRLNVKILGSTDNLTYSARIYPLRGKVAV